MPLEDATCVLSAPPVHISQFSIFGCAIKYFLFRFNHPSPSQRHSSEEQDCTQDVFDTTENLLYAPCGGGYYADAHSNCDYVCNHLTEYFTYAVNLCVSVCMLVIHIFNLS